MDIRPQGMVKKSGDTMTGSLLYSLYGLYLGVAGVATLIGSDGWHWNHLIFPQQAPTASAPAYVKGAIYFDTTLNKLRVGGAAGWETITSV